MCVCVCVCVCVRIMRILAIYKWLLIRFTLFIIFKQKNKLNMLALIIGHVHANID